MHRIHFIAIGGAAMHNLALAINQKAGYVITGSDDEIFEPSRSRLEAAGLLPKELGWFPERITKDLDAVILGMHAQKDNPELLRAKELGLKIYSFPEYLYEQTKDKIRIVVGGSHGKTTTTAMILYVLQKMGIEADYMVGAQIEGFERMVRLSDSAKYAVFEGDEYLTSPLDPRSKFHLYKPHIAILTGIAWDHINVFPTFDKYVDTFRQFVNLIEQNGSFIYFQDDNNLRQLATEARKDITLLPYTTPEFEVNEGITSVKVLSTDRFQSLKVFGRHNLQNMQAARLACQEIGVSESDFYGAISSFTGASNRLEKICQTPDSVAFKDFAHSPSKLRATVEAVRQQYPDKQLIACMELHTYSSLMAEFLPQYDHCMQLADKAFVYFNPEVITHKRLAQIEPADVAKAFGTDNVEVFTDSQQLQAKLRSLDYHNTALLMMTSGNFDGINIPDFATDLLNPGFIKQKNLDNRYMRMARIWAENSYCQRRKVGALLVKDKMIISDGYNGTPSGFPNQCEDENNVSLPYVLHAEANAITKVARSNNSSDGATLYVTASPCMECAKLIIQAGIRRVIYGEKYRIMDGVELLEKAGIEVVYAPDKKDCK